MLGGNELEEISPQVEGELLRIPWGHHKYIIDKRGSDSEKATFYVDKVLENNWINDMQRKG